MNFRDNGIASELKFASGTGAATIIAAVTGKRIMIMDVMASAATTLKNGSGGSTLVYAPAGTSQKLGITLGTGEEVYSTAGNVTITYYLTS